jgi:hypothetical protein
MRVAAIQVGVEIAASALVLVIMGAARRPLG